MAFRTHFPARPRLFKYYVLPPVIILFSNVATQLIPQIGTKKFSSISISELSLIGNQESWTLVTILFLWAWVWLAFTRKVHLGPKTDYGFVPIYKAHGELYHLTTLGIMAIIYYFHPGLPLKIYQNAGPILASLNISALALCLVLICRSLNTRAKSADPYHATSSNNYPIFYNIFYGLELHSYMWGGEVNVKQFAMSRLGMHMWQHFNFTYLFAGIQIRDDDGTMDYGHCANVLLQSVYIYKTFHLESVLITMIDMTDDRVGYYIIWGCIVFQPSIYSLQSYCYVANPTGMSLSSSIVIVVLGLGAVWLNFDVLRQKRYFRECVKSGKVAQIWGKPAKKLTVTYYEIKENGQSVKRTSHLLLSGWWGMARKMNYFWELISTAIWSYPGHKLGILNYAYFIYLAGLFVIRAQREDNKCRLKYGQGWDLYCSKVPYKIIPYLF